MHNGYLIDHGEPLRLKAGEGRYVYDDYWTTTRLEYEFEDERGRTHVFTGEPRGFHHMGAATVLAVVQWRTRDGETGWGQYDWHGNLYQQKKRRTARLSGLCRPLAVREPADHRFVKFVGHSDCSLSLAGTRCDNEDVPAPSCKRPLVA